MDVQQVEQYEDFKCYLDSIREGAGSKFEKGKAKFAARISSLLLPQSAFEVLDLRLRVDELCRFIRRWNNIPD
jgi:hypothetical protein